MRITRKHAANQVNFNNFLGRVEEFGGLGDLDGVFDQVFDLFVAFDGDGDDSAAAGGDLLNVAEGDFRT
jgi:hypothetical protein